MSSRSRRTPPPFMLFSTLLLLRRPSSDAYIIVSLCLCVHVCLSVLLVMVSDDREEEAVRRALGGNVNILVMEGSLLLFTFLFVFFAACTAFC